MYARLRHVVLLVGMGLGATNACAAIEVDFVNPQHYRDAGSGGYGGVERERTLGELRTYFEQLGTRCLASGQTLKIRVLDLDLAGQFEWKHYGDRELRVLRDVTWPSMRLAWTRANADGSEAAAREERLVDMNYLSNRAYVSRTTSLPYEKAMIGAWFEKRFCAPPVAGRD